MQPNTESQVASRYGDGFISSSSHPELGQKYWKAAKFMWWLWSFVSELSACGL